MYFTPGFYLRPQLLTRAAVTSLPAYLDVVSRDTGTVTRKEIVLMALMNRPLVVREQASKHAKCNDAVSETLPLLPSTA